MEASPTQLAAPPMTPTRLVSAQDGALTALPDIPDDNTSSSREIGSIATWSVSSCKAGYGVAKLRDNNFDTYWQSDGPQPHLINIQFPKKVTLKQVSLYTNIRADESYTPQRIAIRAGSSVHDLVDVTVVSLEHPHPEGWVHVPLLIDPGAGPNDNEEEEEEEENDHDDDEPDPSGTRARKGSRKQPLRCHLLQIAVLTNLQNGKDTHVRQVHVFAPKTRPIPQDNDMPPFTSLEFEMHSTLR